MSSNSENPLIQAARRQADAARRMSARGSGSDPPGGAWATEPQGWSEYELLGEIRRGGQGVVYRAVQRSTRRVVALKVLRESPLAIERDRARFDREVQILASVSHPNVVTIHDSGTRDGWRYYVMDFIDGVSLDAHVERQTWASPRQRIEAILTLLVKVCDAVHAAHLHGVIHRDLKPGNILVDSQGEPHVVDFGLARSVQPAGDDSEREAMTQTGQFVGTLPWASPEQAAGRVSEVDVRTDVYSLGVVLYQLLTGRFPYQVTGPLRDVLNEIVASPPQRPRELLRELDDDVETILLKCLEKQPERRYQSAGELARDLRRRLAGEPIDAKRDSMLYILRKSVRRHRAAVFAGGVLLLLLVASTITFRTLYLQQAAARREAADAAREARLRAHETHEAAAFLMDHVAARLTSLLGASDLRAELLGDAYERFASLTRESSDPEVQTDLARLHGKLANLARDLGRPDDAQAHLDSALRIVEEQLQRWPAERPLQTLRADLEGQRGDLARWRGDIETAAQAYGVLHDTYERLTAAEPDDPALLRGLSMACERRAVLAGVQKDPDADLAWSRRMFELKQRVVDQMPDNANARYELSIAHERLGRREPDKATAAGHIEAAMRIREELVEQSPQDGRFLRALSISYEQMAIRAGAARDPAADRQWTERMVELKLRLIAIEPQNALYQHDYAVSLERMSSHLRKDDPAKALALSAEALETFRRLEAADPRSVRFAADVEQSLFTVGLRARAAGEIDLARQRWVELLERHDRADVVVPPDPRRPFGRAQLLCILAELEHAAGRLEDMRRYREAARRQLEALATDGGADESADRLHARLDALPD